MKDLVLSVKGSGNKLLWKRSVSSFQGKRLKSDWQDDDDYRCDKLHVTDVGLKSVAHSLKDLKYLQKLTLEFDHAGSHGLSRFSEKGRRYLSQTLKKIASLKSVKIQVP